MYTVRPPFFLKLFYPRLIWRKSNKEKILYLTFDDGPIPEITPFILDTLKEFGVKGTFFCVGENITKHPEIFKRCLDEGHSVGNHTFNHLNGFKTPNEDYLTNVQRCQELLPGNLFRPPYGRIKPRQVKRLSGSHQIIMWDVLSGDFDVHISGEKCLSNVIRYSRNGSIVVFHDNIKAIPRVKYALPRTIEYFLEQGYRFDVL